MGAKLSKDHLLPTIPVIQTIPRCLAQRNESFRVVVPTSSSTLSNPPGHTTLTCPANRPGIDEDLVHAVFAHQPFTVVAARGCRDDGAVVLGNRSGCPTHQGR